jgi:hypothetical protein
LEEEIGEKLSNEQFHNLYSSPYILTAIKSERLRCAGHINYMEGVSKCIPYLGQNTLREEIHWEMA